MKMLKSWDWLLLIVLQQNYGKNEGTLKYCGQERVFCIADLFPRDRKSHFMVEAKALAPFALFYEYLP